MRQYLEGLHIPRYGVERIEKDVDPSVVARVLVEEHGYKSEFAPAEIENIIEKAKYLSATFKNGVGELLNPQVRWHREIWPIDLLRMTRMYPPETDHYNINSLVLKGGKGFYPFAIAIKGFPDVIKDDLGFMKHELRDQLPIIGVRGILNNHIIDGHHRTTLAIWDGRRVMESLTAYKK